MDDYGKNGHDIMVALSCCLNPIRYSVPRSYEILSAGN